MNQSGQAAIPKEPFRESPIESPEYARMSLAAAMTLGYSPGMFYRGASLRCINLLLTYDSGCAANCAFCGLAREKKKNYGDKKFIRVAWKSYPMDDVLNRLANPPDHVERVCISMITHKNSKRDVIQITRDIREGTGLPVSLLITPTLLTPNDLIEMKQAGADRVGVAIDAATPEIFDKLRGSGVRGPHKWDQYWDTYKNSIEIFGRGMAGVHLIVGLGETEKQMIRVIDRARAMGGFTHLFSFFPERGSALADHPQPPMGQYRRIQAARWLIDHDLSSSDRMTFNKLGQVTDFGMSSVDLQKTLAGGEAFETSGCPGASGRTACNRPYGNERPGPDIRNFPFTLVPEDLKKAMGELYDYASAWRALGFPMKILND